MQPKNNLFIGIDVGSTTVKAVVVDIDKNNINILWKKYQRHKGMQAAMLLSFLESIEKEFPPQEHIFQIFTTGSGGRSLTPFINAAFVQEVNAVSIAVEFLHNDVGSIIELGGQDAKIIVWQRDKSTGKVRKLPSMNDKCAGGTGAVIDKISAKLKLTKEDLQSINFFDTKIHNVAAKCGVFAETDINGLQKKGVCSNELMASLFEAVVQQNLSVLTRGNTLLPKVLLLGGPNTFIPAMQDAWKKNIPKIWEERKTPLPSNSNPHDLITVPQNAVYYAAIGAALYGSEENKQQYYQGIETLKNFIGSDKKGLKEKNSGAGLVESEEELEQFLKEYQPPPFEKVSFSENEIVNAYLGIDGGSTSTKAVLMNCDNKIIARSYILSQGNPLDDIKIIAKDLLDQITEHGAELNILGVGTTGYAKDILTAAIKADVGIVETIAHTNAALKYYPDTDVIVDVGGQDIKVIFLKNGIVKDFRLNTQCSAGNGYFLQNTANKFGIDVKNFASHAFTSRRAPSFHYGCAVFLESDIVNFQQLGWEKREILAGLAKVLPKNIWLYVVQEPNLAKFGTNYVLQGGTQRNMAAVKSQVDFIKSKVPNVKINIHKYAGESGAIGAALEAKKICLNKQTSFIGMNELINFQFSTRRDESTRCSYCQNKCLRTFIDLKTKDESRRFIVATCEKGECEEKADMIKVLKATLKTQEKNPNFSEIASQKAFQKFQSNPCEPTKLKKLLPGLSGKKMSLRESIRIGIPRVLNFYSTAPFFTTYLETAGIKKENIIFSPFTSEALYKKGSKRGSIDPCFPSKVAISHVHNLIYKQNVDIIFFPMIINIMTNLKNIVAPQTCPTASTTPEVAKAAFKKERDIFADHKIKYLNPLLNMAEPNLFSKQMFSIFKPILKFSYKEHERAMLEGYKTLRYYENKILKEPAQKILLQLENENRVGLVLLGRPYHNDPGINHEIIKNIQNRGYPIFTIDSLPTDKESLSILYKKELDSGEITDPMDIQDVWKNSFSENSNKKIWAAKYTARHPNLAAIDLSNFRCGHDAPIYDVIESILEPTKTPYFTFHDIDENKSAGSIKIRIETIDYFLKQYMGLLRTIPVRSKTQQSFCESFEKMSSIGGNS